MNTIHESSRYSVKAMQGDDKAGLIVVSFSGVGAKDASTDTFFGYALAHKLGLPWVGIVAKNNDWYRHIEFGAALMAARLWMMRRAAQMSGPKPDLIGYGVSMGGYAAIKYSALLDLDYVYAMAPQWSIDPAEVTYKSHFQTFYTPELAGMGIRSEDVQGSIFVFFDPYEEPDRREFAEISKQCNAFAIPVCRGGHMVTERMKGTAAFARLIAARHVPADLLRIASEISRTSPDHINWMIWRGHETKARLLGAAILARFARDKEAARRNRERQELSLLQLCASLLYKGESAMAYRLLAYAVAPSQSLFSLTYVMTWNGELLCYDPIEKVYSSTVHHVPRGGVPVILYEEILGALRPSGFEPLPLTRSEGGTGIFLHDGSGYLSSRPGGAVITVPHAQGWEQFYLLSPATKSAEREISSN